MPIVRNEWYLRSQVNCVLPFVEEIGGPGNCEGLYFPSDHFCPNVVSLFVRTAKRDVRWPSEIWFE